MVERQRYRGNRGPQIACRPICTYESPRGFPRSVLIQSCSHASAPARRARRRALGLVPSVRDRDTMILDADADSNGPGSTSYLGPHAYFLTFFRIGCSTMHKSPPRLGVGGVGDAWPFMEVVVGTVRNTFVYHPAPRTRTRCCSSRDSSPEKRVGSTQLARASCDAQLYITVTLFTVYSTSWLTNESRLWTTLSRERN